MHRPYEAEQVAAYILVGGRSRRMGRDKARLSWRGQPLVGVLRDRLQPLVAEVFLVAKSGAEYEDLGLRLIRDEESDPALVHGIASALRSAGPPWRLLLACDMPGIGAPVVHALWAAAQERGRGSFPQLGNHHEPLPSLWHHALGREIRGEWGLRAQEWLRHAGLTPWRVPEEDRRRLTNVNTPEQWQDWIAEDGHDD